MSTQRIPEVIPIWSRRDSVDTAQAFHAEIDNAEVGVPDVEPEPRWTSKLFGRSRFRRAKVYDGLAVALLMALMAALGAVLFFASAPHAKADTGDDPEVVAWAGHYAGAVCSVLATYPTTTGLQGILKAAVGEGLTPYQAGEAVALSVYDTCPRYSYILDLYVAKWGGRSVA